MRSFAGPQLRAPPVPYMPVQGPPPGSLRLGSGVGLIGTPNASVHEGAKLHAGQAPQSSGQELQSSPGLHTPSPQRAGPASGIDIAPQVQAPHAPRASQARVPAAPPLQVQACSWPLVHCSRPPRVTLGEQPVPTSAAIAARMP